MADTDFFLFYRETVKKSVPFCVVCFRTEEKFVQPKYVIRFLQLQKPVYARIIVEKRSKACIWCERLAKKAIVLKEVFLKAGKVHEAMKSLAYNISIVSNSQTAALAVKSIRELLPLPRHTDVLTVDSSGVHLGAGKCQQSLFTDTIVLDDEESTDPLGGNRLRARIVHSTSNTSTSAIQQQKTLAVPSQPKHANIAPKPAKPVNNQQPNNINAKLPLPPSVMPTQPENCFTRPAILKKPNSVKISITPTMPMNTLNPIVVRSLPENSSILEAPKLRNALQPSIAVPVAESPMSKLSDMLNSRWQPPAAPTCRLVTEHETTTDLPENTQMASMSYQLPPGRVPRMVTLSYLLYNSETLEEDECIAALLLDGSNMLAKHGHDPSMFTLHPVLTDTRGTKYVPTLNVVVSQVCPQDAETLKNVTQIIKHTTNPGSQHMPPQANIINEELDNKDDIFIIENDIPIQDLTNDDVMKIPPMNKDGIIDWELKSISSTKRQTNMGINDERPNVSCVVENYITVSDDTVARQPIAPQMKKDGKIDWEDKIPMDVISFMDNNVKLNIEQPPPPPPPVEEPEEILGIISEVRSEADDGDDDLFIKDDPDSQMIFVKEEEEEPPARPVKRRKRRKQRW